MRDVQGEDEKGECRDKLTSDCGEKFSDNECGAKQNVQKN